MDEDDFTGIMVLCAFILIFLLFPLLLILGISACTAYARTRKWAKEQKNRRLHNSATNKSTPEHESLVSSTQDDVEAPSSDNELEEDLDNQFFIDTDDEEDYKAQKAEEKADRMLTTDQKFRKEFRKIWSGSVAKRLAREREREERRKIAKTVARVIELADRRRAKRDANGATTAAAGSSSAAGSAGAGAADDLLPRYETAIAEDRKA